MTKEQALRKKEKMSTNVVVRRAYEAHLGTGRLMMRFDKSLDGCRVYPLDECLLPREGLIDKIVNKLKVVNSVLVRGPPACGKTTALQLMYMKLNPAPGKCLYVSCLQFLSSKLTLERYMVGKAEAEGIRGLSFNELINTVDYILLDDAQRSYDVVDFRQFI